MIRRHEWIHTYHTIGSSKSHVLDMLSEHNDTKQFLFMQMQNAQNWNIAAQALQQKGKAFKNLYTVTDKIPLPGSTEAKTECTSRLVKPKM